MRVAPSWLWVAINMISGRPREGKLRKYLWDNSLTEPPPCSHNMSFLHRARGLTSAMSHTWQWSNWITSVDPLLIFAAPQAGPVLGWHWAGTGLAAGIEVVSLCLVCFCLNPLHQLTAVVYNYSIVYCCKKRHTLIMDYELGFFKRLLSTWSITLMLPTLGNRVLAILVEPTALGKSNNAIDSGKIYYSCAINLTSYRQT